MRSIAGGGGGGSKKKKKKKNVFGQKRNCHKNFKFL
jgi:hypothetical protein